MIASILSVPFRYHVALSFVIHLFLIVFGEFQDKYAEVPFTDIDYHVVTDGARHILNNESPYERHTYRYTPILAYLLTLNVFIHGCVGKLLFTICNLVIAFVIRQILLDEQQQTYETHAATVMAKNRRLNEKSANVKRYRFNTKREENASKWALFWLYNPMAMVIATRGNGDSISSLFILATILLLQRSQRELFQRRLLTIILAGLCHGISIHLRLFPLAFSLAYYLFLSENRQSKSLLTIISRPNRWQLLLAITTIVTLSALTIVFYLKYGYEFLYEAYIYHLVRKDTRHNFSLYFYMNLLNAESLLIEKILTFLPQLIVLLAINVAFGSHRRTLGFCIFLQTFIIVAFNPVVTSQYFIWYLAILPICLKNLKSLGVRRSISYIVLWCSVQAIWLYSAYLLEFKGWNTFGFIWMQCVIFFAVNCFIVKVLVVHFDPLADI